MFPYEKILHNAAFRIDISTPSLIGKGSINKHCAVCSMQKNKSGIEELTTEEFINVDIPIPRVTFFRELQRQSNNEERRPPMVASTNDC